MRFHILAVPHTITHKDYVACAFTQKVFKFCAMMSKRGHTLFHYGHQDSQVECTEHVTVISREEYNSVYGEHDWRKNNFKFDLNDAAYQVYNKNTIQEINIRKKKGDFVLAFWGMGNKAVCDALEDVIIVEPGIGYSQAFAKFRIYESYALLHANLGLDNVQFSGNLPWYHCVIPNYFDPLDFEFSAKKEDYFLCLGRITTAKGVNIAIDVTGLIGARLIIAGQGSCKDLHLESWPSHVEHVGYADAEKRKELMKNAKGVFILSTYVEPFGGAMIESFFSGTPVITTDWGAFAENNLHGVTGYRCRTFDHMVWAAKNIHTIDPKACREWANNFTLDKVAPMYEEYFTIASQDWYTVDESRTQLSWMTRTLPSLSFSVDAFFQCFKQVKAADKALESYRKCYPTGKIVMLNDGGDHKMHNIAIKYNVDHYFYYRENIGISYWKNPVQWLERFFEGLQHIDSEFFVMQEEDVFHVRPVRRELLTFDICGTNPDALLPQELVDYIHSVTGKFCTHYTGSGGCFFKTYFFKQLAKTDWKKHMVHVPHRWLWADVVISLLTHLYGGTIGYCTECVELGRPEYNEHKDHAVIHQYKNHYI